jgi:HlyD family secretion protein
MKRLALALALACAAACNGERPLPVYQAVPVEKRDIVVSAQAAGTIEPEVTVEVKSKASGEILAVDVETGQNVPKGTLMVRVDQRAPRNTLAQARAELEVAEARVKIAESQNARSEKLYKAQSIAETAREQTMLEFSNARAEVVRARVAVENAQIAMDDTNVIAPIDGTILSKTVEAGQVISSPTRDVSGGTVLLRMADLNKVQVRTLVDETDIGKIQPGLAATVTVAAYPNQPFEGRVSKLEPQSLTEQNVTMFPVLVQIDNRGGLLRPGMNCEVEIHVGQRVQVLAIPNAALRTERDAVTAASVLGLSEEQLMAQLSPPDVGERGPRGSVQAAERTNGDGNGNGNGGNGWGDGPRRGGTRPAANSEPGETESLFGGEYVVFALRGGAPTALRIRTGLTDLDHSEVVSGLELGDSVLILPSAGLVRSQQQFRERMDRMTGGTMPGMGSGRGQGGGGRPQGRPQ